MVEQRIRNAWVKGSSPLSGLMMRNFSHSTYTAKIDLLHKCLKAPTKDAKNAILCAFARDNK